MAFDATEYKKKFNRDKYAEFKIRIPKSKKDVLDGLVQTTGKSINRIFVDAVEKMHGVDLTIVESELEQLK